LRGARYPLCSPLNTARWLVRDDQLYTDSHVIFSSLQTLYKSHVRLTIAADVTRSTTTPLGLKSRMDPSRQATSATPTHAEFSFLSQPSMTLTESKFGGSVQDGLRPGRQQIVYYRKIMDEYVARLEDVIKDVRLDVSPGLAANQSLQRAYHLVNYNRIISVLVSTLFCERYNSPVRYMYR
jgi:hypothetical protein